MKFKKALRFDWLTYFYDWFMNITGAGKKFVNILLDQTDIKDGDKILDFGCGTASFLIEAERRNPGANFYGVDVDPKILRIAEKKIMNNGSPVLLREYDGDILPYKGKEFHKVFSSLVFHHLTQEQKIKALKELYRILRPGGRLYILDFGETKNILMRFMFLFIQIFDGFEGTSDNVRGLLFKFIKEAGFKEVAEEKRIVTPLGMMSLYTGIKRFK